MASTSTGAPEAAHASVFAPSESVTGAPEAGGPDFTTTQPELFSLLDSYNNIGFQATSLGQAIDIINQMVSACIQKSLFEPVLSDEHGTIWMAEHSASGDSATNLKILMPSRFQKKSVKIQDATSCLALPPT